MSAIRESPLFFALGATLVSALFAVLLTSGPQGANAQEGEEARGPTRANYIQAVEPICAKNTRQNMRILKGVRREVRQGKLAPAARKFRRATRAFTQTLKQVLAVPRPAEDRRQLGEWLMEMLKQRAYLAKVTKALQHRNGFKAQQLSLRLISNARAANLVVDDYGFRYCILRPGSFM